MPITVERLLATMQRSQSMPDKDLVALLERRSSDSQEPATARMVQELIRERCITPYQAKILSDGGSIEFGDYLIVDMIGKGIAGAVYKARDFATGRLVALRILDDEVVEPVKSKGDFEQAVEPAVYLTHRNLVDHYDVGVRHGRRFIATEFVTGSSLFELRRKSGQISVIDSLAYILQAAHGLAHAHSHDLFHGALSPQNLIVDDKHLLKISDFGIGNLRTRFAIQELAAKKGMDAAAFDYIAPEQFKNSRGVDAQTDIYALGCVLFFLLTAKPLFGGRAPADKQRAHCEDPIPQLPELRDDLPFEVQSLFEKMVAKSPRNRFRRMDDVVDGLNQVLETIENGKETDGFRQSIAAQQTQSEIEPSDESPRPSKRWPTGLAVYFAATITIAAALLAYFGYAWQLDNQAASGDLKPSTPAGEHQPKDADNQAPTLRDTSQTNPTTKADVIVDRLELIEIDTPALAALTRVWRPLASSHTESSGPREIGEIRRLGIGDVVISESERVTTSDGEIERLRDLIAQGERIEIKRLDLSGTSFVDDDLKYLSPLTSLTSLSLYQCDHVTDEGIQHLGDLINLESVDLRGTLITAAGLAGLPDAPIQSIMINSLHDQMNGNAIDQLANRFDKSLTTLWVDGISLNENDFRSLGRLNNLQDLRLTYVGIPNRWLEYLQDLPGLVNLNLSGNEGIDDGSLDHLERIEGLRTLNLNLTSVTDREKFNASLAACTIVWE